MLMMFAAAVAVSNVTIAGPLGPLAGTLVEARRGAPVVLIIPGSGPTDRDGNNPLGVKGGIYRQLADGLAARGVSSLRIDKRGMFGSKAAIANANRVTIADYAADVSGWARLLKARGHRCTWLAGHSEGGLVALAAAQRTANLCGLILLSAPGRPVGQALREQLRPLPPADYAKAETAIRSLEARRTIDPASLPKPLQPVFAAQVQPYLIDLLSYDPARLAGSTRLPLLVIQGDADLQTSLADARALIAAHPGARLTLLPGVNHVWKRATRADRAGNIATYGKADLPIDAALPAAIAAFVKSRP